MKNALWLNCMLGLWLAVVGLVVAQSPVEVVVAQVGVAHEGPGALDESSVMAYIGLKPGDTYTPGAISRDVHALQETKRFSHVYTRVERQPDGGVEVTYVVKNKPRLRYISVEGAEYVSNRRVRDLLELKVGEIVDDVVLGVHAQKVYEFYRKRYFLDPRLTWEITENQETSTADVRITVHEGRRAGVWKVGFSGNDSVSRRALRKVMTQGAWRPWSWISKGNKFDPFDLDQDHEKLRRVYMDQGYLDVVIGEPIIQKAHGKLINITIPVEEGAVYHIRKVTVEGVALFSTEEINRVLKLRAGDVASMAAIETDRQNLRDFYGSRGYIRTGVQVQLDPDVDQSLVDLVFNVQEGKLSTIRDVGIRGNTRTKDKVIRRELVILPGDIYDEVRVRRSENRLRNMGYFSMVRAVPEPTGKNDQYDLVFDIEETKTGQFMAGVGFSSVDNVVGFAEIAQNNFDLFNWPYMTGGGQKVQLRTQLGSERTDVDFSFVEPWFLDRRLALELNLFRSEKSYLSSDYDQVNIGGIVGVSRALGNFNRIKLSYGLEEIEIKNVRESASETIKEEEGSRMKSSVTLALTHDTRDQFFIPTRGNRSILSATLAGGPLQGDTDLYLLEARTSQYFPLWADHVFSLRGWVAVVEEYGDSERVPIFDRLFVGGGRTVRGFRFRDIGPRDENNEPIGGNTAIFMSAEYTIPVVDKIRLAAFYDAGMVWADSYEIDFNDLNSAAGVGVRFDIPGFPLRFDYAWPLETDEYNDRESGRFSFMIGHQF